MHVFGHSESIPEGDVILELEIHDTTLTQRASITALEHSETPSTVSRLAANCSLDTLEGDAYTDMAVRYQLLTDKTSYIVIDQREADEKTDGAPAIRKVDQMLPAGWGGTSSVHKLVSGAMESASFSPEAPIMACMESADLEIGPEKVDDDLRPPTPWDEFCKIIASMINDRTYSRLTLNDLHHFGVPRWVLGVLGGLGDAGFAEPEIIRLFLFRLAGLRLKDTVDIQTRNRLKDRLPEIPAGMMGVIMPLIKAIETDMNDPIKISTFHRQDMIDFAAFVSSPTI